MWILKRLFVLLGALVLAALAMGQAGLLQGRPPPDLGVHDGRLKPPSTNPNSVSSQAGLYPGHPQRPFAQIAPLRLRGDLPATMEAIATIVAAMPGARIVKREPGYLYAQFTSRWMKFVDDVEFWADPAAQAVQVRSASRLGRGDLGVNRARIEAVRAALAAPARGPAGTG